MGRKRNKKTDMFNQRKVKINIDEIEPPRFERMLSDNVLYITIQFLTENP
jgi:hypothetical protein